MLSKDEERTVEQILLEFARRGQSRAAETASILSRMPANPEAVDHLVELARKRGLPWVEYLAGTLSAIQKDVSGVSPRPAPPRAVDLATLLASGEQYPRKVDALLAAARAPTPALAELIRSRLPVEADPFVLATLVSCLPSCGEAGPDGPRLRPFIGHADARVCANALEALRKLGVKVAPAELAAPLASAEHRVAMNALALLAQVDSAATLARAREQVGSPDPARRAGLGFLLGDLGAEPDATALLMRMLETEQQTLVLKQLARSLKRHAGRPHAGAVADGIAALARKASGAKRSILDSLLHELRTGGLPVEDDTEMTFADVWGAPAPAAREPAPEEPPPAAAPPPPRTGRRWLAGAAAGALALAGFVALRPAPDPVPAEPASVALRRQAAAAPKTALGGLASRAAPRPAAGWSGGGGGAAVAEPAAAPVVLPIAGQDGVKIPKHFGKVGAKVDVQGKVVGVNAGAPIVEAAGRFFMIVAGPVPEDLRAGDPFHLLGRLVGRSLEGLIYVETRSK